MKKILGVAAFLLVATASFSIRENVGAPTTGSVANGSWVDVRVTANVVEGIAVNEASPIDFGNLVKDSTGKTRSAQGVYREGEIIRENTPGIVTYRANTNKFKSFKTYLDYDRIDLGYVGNSGVIDEESTRNELTNIKIEGINLESVNGGDDVTLNNGQAQKKLTAWFKAYDKTKAGENKSYEADYENGNLGKQQKLGNYEGKIRVFAVAIGAE